MSEELQWINAREMYNPGKLLKPPIDHIISDIVGFPVYTTDPRIIKTVVKWKRKRKDSGESDVPDNFLTNPQFIKEIKELFTKPL